MRFDATRIAFVLLLGVIAPALFSCTAEPPSLRQGGQVVAEQPVAYPESLDTALRNRVSQIHVGMTFEEVAQLTTIYTNGLQLVEHGGIWFHSPLGTNWIMMLRFEAPSSQPDMLKRKLNWKPVIRARVANEASW